MKIRIRNTSRVEDRLVQKLDQKLGYVQRAAQSTTHIPNLTQDRKVYSC